MMSFARFRIALLLTIAAGAALFAHGAHAQQYTRFGPATGILVGNVNTPQTTAAASSNVISLWTGTCNASSFLKGDGSCAIPAGTGVTSVALTMPSGFSVSGSPITTTGTFGVTTALSGLINGTGSGFSNATSTEVIAEFSGTCNSGTFLRGDGTCAVAGGGTSGANPSASVGLTAVNGVATTFLRSDGAPALSQAISPTWTGTHIFSVNPVKITTAASDNTLTLTAAGAATDAKNTLVRTNSAGTFAISRATDAAPTIAADNAFIATRSGGAYTGLIFGNAADNPTYSFAGTGGATFNTAGEAITVKGNTTGAANLGYIAFRDSAATRTGYVGDGGGADSSIILQADTASANIVLTPGSGGSALVGARPITTSTTTAIKVAFANIHWTSSGVCNYVSQSGFTGACAESSNQFTLTLAAGALSSGAACTGTQTTQVANRLVTATVNTTVNVTVTTFTSASAVANDFYLTCMSL